jgi:hypothetical protein
MYSRRGVSVGPGNDHWNKGANHPERFRGSAYGEGHPRYHRVNEPGPDVFPERMGTFDIIRRAMDIWKRNLMWFVMICGETYLIQMVLGMVAGILSIVVVPVIILFSTIPLIAGGEETLCLMVILQLVMFGLIMVASMVLGILISGIIYGGIATTVSRAVLGIEPRFGDTAVAGWNGIRRFWRIMLYMTMASLVMQIPIWVLFIGTMVISPLLMIVFILIMIPLVFVMQIFMVLLMIITMLAFLVCVVERKVPRESFRRGLSIFRANMAPCVGLAFTLWGVQLMAIIVFPIAFIIGLALIPFMFTCLAILYFKDNPAPGPIEPFDDAYFKPLDWEKGLFGNGPPKDRVDYGGYGPDGPDVGYYRPRG